MAFDGRLLSGATVLAAVVESGSFTRAGELLGLSASGVSRSVSRLEERIGVRLLDRTTRALRLTDEGAHFHRMIVPHLDGMEEAANLVSGAAEIVRGRLRASVNPIFAQHVIAPRLGDLIARFPDLELDLLTPDGRLDLVSDGVDVAIRFGPQPMSNLTSRLILETRVLTVASPAYLERRGRPGHPAELADHACIQFRDPMTGQPFEWEFRRGQDVLPVATRGQLILSDPRTMMTACLAGAGVAQILAIGVQQLLDEGRLVELFPDWPGEIFPLYAVRPSKRLAPIKVEAFIDFCCALVR